MQKEEVYNLVRIVDMSYKGFIKNIEETTESWYKVLKDYRYKDIQDRLDKLMAMEQFQYQPPTLPYLVKEIPSISEENRRNSFYYTCNICTRKFKSKEEYEKHFSRCSSVRYVIKQSKKWFNQDLEKNKRELYLMSEEEFNERYRKLIIHIQQNTKDEVEKKCIEHILNPPSPEIAKKFINRGA